MGKPVECTGLVSERVFRMVKSGSKVNAVSGGAHIHFPNGGESIHVAKSEKTVVMDRDEFDKDAAGMAVGAGVDLRVGGARVTGVTATHRGGQG